MAVLPIPGVTVGHWTDRAARTGCTVIRFEQPTIASGEIRGGAPATREFGLLDPRRTVSRVDAVVLSGGSAFGLAACDGVSTALERERVGFETPHARVPIVVGMSLYDLGVGDSETHPDATSGADALATAAASFDTGQIGAGAGATVGTWRGPEHAEAAGLGFAVARKDALIVAALVAVNASGDVVAGGSGERLTTDILSGAFDWPETGPTLAENTTIGVVITNGRFTKLECTLLAEGAHDGLARAIIPAHTPSDGDAFVAVSCPGVDGRVRDARLLAAVAVESAIATVADNRL